MKERKSMKYSKTVVWLNILKKKKMKKKEKILIFNCYLRYFF